MPVVLAQLIGEHPVRHPAEAAGIARTRVDFDDLERVAQQDTRAASLPALSIDR